ncbi:MAG: hypothetical protein QM496_03125 [Verrucomicrobiota bacterium]
MGAERATTIANIIREKGVTSSNEYLYGNRPLREEVLEEWIDDAETNYAVVSINSYGCKVLNTASSMFVDVDFPKPVGLSFFVELVKSLFGSKSPCAREVFEHEAIAKLQNLALSDPRFGVRIYRTFAGLRYLITHIHADPTSTTTSRIMELLGADPLYVKLCQRQECFRARLSPKPWRCGIKQTKKHFPWKSVADEKTFRDWQDEYSEKSQHFASCHYLDQIGDTTMDAKISRVVEFHDKETKALSKTIELA